MRKEIPVIEFSEEKRLQELVGKSKPNMKKEVMFL